MTIVKDDTSSLFNNVNTAFVTIGCISFCLLKLNLIRNVISHNRGVVYRDL